MSASTICAARPTGAPSMSRTSEPPCRDGRSLRADVLRFLSRQARPGSWTWFAGAAPDPGLAPPGDRPDLVIEVAGRVVYVEIRAPHLGPLPAARRAWQAAARCRGAAVATVRSVPDVERLLAGLGVGLRKPRILASELVGQAKGRSLKHGKIETRADPPFSGPHGGGPGAADAPDGGPAAP